MIRNIRFRSESVYTAVPESKSTESYQAMDVVPHTHDFRRSCLRHLLRKSPARSQGHCQTVNNTIMKGTVMKERTRNTEFKLRLSDDELFILNEKWRLSALKSRSAFLRNLIIYGYVYDVMQILLVFAYCGFLPILCSNVRLDNSLRKESKMVQTKQHYAFQ